MLTRVDSQVAKAALAHVGKAGTIGLMLGMIVGAVSYNSKFERDRSVYRLKLRIEYLKTDPVFLQAVIDVVEHRQNTPQSRALCDKIVDSCEGLVSNYLTIQSPHVKNSGVAQFRMSRYLLSLRRASVAFAQLTKEAQDIDIEDRVSTLVEMGDNYVHNVTLL